MHHVVRIWLETKVVFLGMSLVCFLPSFRDTSFHPKPQVLSSPDYLSFSISDSVHTWRRRMTPESTRIDTLRNRSFSPAIRVHSWTSAMVTSGYPVTKRKLLGTSLRHPPRHFNSSAHYNHSSPAVFINHFPACLKDPTPIDTIAVNPQWTRKPILQSLKRVTSRSFIPTT